MTNAELIQKIRAEIERLKGIGGIVPLDNREQKTGFESALIDIEIFLDTLESEKPINPDDAMKELDEKIALVKQRGTWDGVDVDKYMDEVRGREPENPVPKDLEEAAEEYADCNSRRWQEDGDIYYDHHKIVASFIAGAKWQAEKDARDMYMSDNRHFEKVYQLGKKDMKEQMMKDGLDAVKSGQSNKIEKTIAGVFVKYGMDMQKQDMMKEAVEGTVVDAGFDDSTALVSIPDKRYDEGDKVRIIVIPNTDKK